MRWVVLAAWVIQATVGVWLLIGWARHTRQGAPAIITHAVMMVGVLAIWVGFLVTDSVWWAWAAFGVLTVGIPFGDRMMVHRSRRLRGVHEGRFGDWMTSAADVFAGRMPPKVTFHALFGAVVYFSCLGVAIGASIAA